MDGGWYFWDWFWLWWYWVEGGGPWGRRERLGDDEKQGGLGWGDGSGSERALFHIARAATMTQQFLNGWKISTDGIRAAAMTPVSGKAPDWAPLGGGERKNRGTDGVFSANPCTVIGDTIWTSKLRSDSPVRHRRGEGGSAWFVQSNTELFDLSGLLNQTLVSACQIFDQSPDAEAGVMEWLARLISIGYTLPEGLKPPT